MAKWNKKHSTEKTDDFSKSVDNFQFNNNEPYKEIFVCTTTDAVKACGAKDLKVMITNSTIEKILSDDIEKIPHAHNLSVQDLKQLPQQLKNPIMILEGSHKNSLVMITDLLDKNNDTVIISIDLEVGTEWNQINRVTSMYGKERIANYLKRQFDNEKLIGCNKKIANQMLHSLGLQLPQENTFIDYTNIISDNNENVNISNKKYFNNLSAQDITQKELDSNIFKSNTEMTVDTQTQMQLDIILETNPESNKHIEHNYFNQSITNYNQSLKETEKSFEQENDFTKKINDFLSGKINPYEQIFVCKTTEVMKACGADELNVVINQSSLKKILSDDKEKFPHAHNISVQELKELPIQLQKPIMVFKGSHDNSMVYVTDINDINSNEILITVDINTVGFNQNVNRITSMYGKNNVINYLKKQLEKGNLIGCDKKRANEMLTIKGLQLPLTTTFIDYTNIISDNNENVNIKNQEILGNDSYTEYENTLNNQLANANELPIDVLCDEGKIQWYSFSSGINNTKKTKELLQKIQNDYKQTVSIYSNNDNYQLVYLNNDLEIVPYDESIYPDADAALKAVLANDKIAKLVTYEAMMQSSMEQDLTDLSKIDNSKYPFVRINESDNSELTQEGYLPFDRAEELFNSINEYDQNEGLSERVNISFFPDGKNTYNLDINLGAESGGMVNQIRRLLSESDISSDKSLQYLQEYMKNNDLFEQEMQSDQAAHLDLLDLAEIT